MLNPVIKACLEDFFRQIHVLEQEANNFPELPAEVQYHLYRAKEDLRSFLINDA